MWDNDEVEQDLHLDTDNEQPGPRDDPAVQELEPLLLELFETNPTTVYYESQICVLFEDKFFHWVTSRALKELRESGKIASQLEVATPGPTLRYYFNRRYRFWRRKGAEVRKLVAAFSDQAFTRALGVQGELLIDAGLPRANFQPVGHTVKAWGGVTWTLTDHDLDRVFHRDGIYYGTEIKNRLGYIPEDEFRAKLAMCDALGLTPLFIARMMPRTYIDQVRRAGGFSLIMKYQFYPVSHSDFALQVRRDLGLPVDCPTRLRDGTLQRFLNWHEIKLHTRPAH